MSANGKTISKSKVMALLFGAMIGTAGASTPEVSAYLFGDSWVDCLASLKKPNDYGSRAEMAAADTHYVMRKAPYKGTVEQNKHMLAHSCPNANAGLIKKIGKAARRKASQYGLKRPSRESYATAKSPYISWELYHTIRQAIRDTARAHGVDENQALQLIGCESIGFNPKATNVSYITVNGVRIRTVDRGLGQINSYFHPEVTDAQAYNWRYSIGWTIRTAKVEFIPKKGKYKGELYSQAAWWICRSSPEYLDYGIASIRAQPKSSQFASNSD